MSEIYEPEFYAYVTGNSEICRMEKVKVISKKYDGSLRDEYESHLYAESDETIILFSEPGLRYLDHRKAAWFEGKDGLLEIYIKRRWYKVWQFRVILCNIDIIFIYIA